MYYNIKFAKLNKNNEITKEGFGSSSPLDVMEKLYELKEQGYTMIESMSNCIYYGFKEDESDDITYDYDNITIDKALEALKEDSEHSTLLIMDDREDMSNILKNIFGTNAITKQVSGIDFEASDEKWIYNRKEGEVVFSFLPEGINRWRPKDGFETFTLLNKMDVDSHFYLSEDNIDFMVKFYDIVEELKKEG